MNKTLMESARSMLSGAGLGQEFWAEAVDTACYLVNRSPSSALRIRLHKKYGLRVKDVIKHEVQPKEPVKIEFELKEGESDSTVEEESEDEEPQTLGVKLVRERGSLKVDSEDGKLWKEAMVDEMASLHKNEAWDLVESPAGRKPIASKWVFKKKTNAKGKVEKYKARLVAKGYSQVSGIDFGDIFLLLPR
eukprot:PITA_17886